MACSSSSSCRPCRARGALPACSGSSWWHLWAVSHHHIGRTTANVDGAYLEGYGSPSLFARTTTLLVHWRSDGLKGRPEITVGLIDGPVITNHPDLAGENIRVIPGSMDSMCTKASSAACMHGTFVAGILCGRRSSVAPAICPNVRTC
jgi:subtilisin family serine protease